MKNSISEEMMHRLAAGSVGTAFRTVVDEAVTKHFRSSLHKTSRLLCDCIVLDLLLNDKITPHSADGIITCIRRSNKALYTNIDTAYSPIESTFLDYARSVLGDEYESVRAMGLKTANFIVYVIASELYGGRYINRSEVYMNTFSYAELLEMGLPRY